MYIHIKYVYKCYVIFIHNNIYSYLNTTLCTTYTYLSTYMHIYTYTYSCFMSILTSWNHTECLCQQGRPMFLKVPEWNKPGVKRKQAWEHWPVTPPVLSVTLGSPSSLFSGGRAVTKGCWNQCIPAKWPFNPGSPTTLCHFLNWHLHGRWRKWPSR